MTSNSMHVICHSFQGHAWAEGIFEFLTKVKHSWPRGTHHAWCCMLANPQNLNIGELGHWVSSVSIEWVVVYLNDEHVIFAEQSISRFDSLQTLSCVLSLERILSIQLSEMVILCVFHICPAWMDMNKMLPRLSFFMWDLVGLVMQEPCYNLQAAHHLHSHWTQQTWFWLSQIVTSPCTRVYGVHMKLIFRKKLESLFWLQGAGIGNVGIWISDYSIIENQRMRACLACGPLAFPHIMHLDTYPHIILFW